MDHISLWSYFKIGCTEGKVLAFHEAELGLIPGTTARSGPECRVRLSQALLVRPKN